MLIEARPPDWAVIGVGVNVAIGAEEFPADLRWPATSIGHGATVDDVREALSPALGRVGRGLRAAGPGGRFASATRWPGAR